MNKPFTILGVSTVFLGVVLILFVSGPGRILDHSEEETPPTPPPEHEKRSVDQIPLDDSDPPAPATVLPIAHTTSQLHSRKTSPQEDFLIIEAILDQFRRHHGGNPIGDNDDIVATLLGRNSRNLAYLPADLASLDPTGQLLDRWGSPYFFHALSGSTMEIRSAGPDQVLFSRDDLVHTP